MPHELLLMFYNQCVCQTMKLSLPNPIPYVTLMTDYHSPIFVDYFEDWTYAGEEAYVPHRHDYHEILWVQSGYALHKVDGQSIELPSQSIALITRGQIHLIKETHALTACAIGFKDDALLNTSPSGENLILLNQLSRPDYVIIPAAEIVDYAHLIALLSNEYTREDVSNKHDFMRFVLNAFLIRVQRLYETAHLDQSGVISLDYQRYRDFLVLLEAHFATHHNVAYYAKRLTLGSDELSKILDRVVGRSAKQITSERILLEAKRLLQFTPHSVKEIAAMLGYQDPYHFGKLFKQVTGLTPLAYRHQWREN